MASEHDYSELLRRFDAHLARIDEHMRRQEAVIARNTEAFERGERASERSERAFERSERFFERSMRAWDTTFAVMTALVRSVEDMRDQIHANTQATLRLLDRFNNGEQSA